MSSVCLDSQFFYVPPVAAGPELASRGLWVQEGAPSKPIFRAPLHPPLPQDAHEPQRDGTRESQADAILILSDNEFDDFDSQSDISFESLGGLLSDARNKVDSGHATSTAGKGVGVVSNNSDAPEPSVAGMSCLDNKSPTAALALYAEQDGPIPAFPVSHRPLVCGSERDALEPADAGLPLQPPYSQDRIKFRRDVGGQCNTGLEADYRPTCSPVPEDREQNGMCSAVPPQVVESRASTSTLSEDDSTGELELVDVQPHFRPQSPCDAAPSRGVDPQLRSGSCRLQDLEYRDDSVQTSDPEHRRPLVPDEREEQDEDSSIVPPQAQDGRAGIPSLSDHESGNERELPNTEPSIQPSASQERAKLHHNIRRCRRRRRCDADDEEDCSHIVGSDAKQGKNEDVVQPPPGKRRRVNTSALTIRKTAPKRRTCPQCTNSQSPHTQRSSPTQHPKRRQSQRSSSKPQPSETPQSSGRSALEEETRTEATFASFEEWPLDAVVLKRVLVDGIATFQVQFTWNPCTNHRRNDTAHETKRHKPPAEKASPTGCALPLRAAPTAKEVQDGDYFQVEDILDGRRRKGRKGRKGGWEYLVKWAGYGHEHNSWEPGAHFEQCPEILQQFHQRKGLPISS